MADYQLPDNFEQDALANWKSGSEAWAKQLDREIEDLKFQVPDLQWDSDARSARSGASINGVSYSSRPMLSVPKINQPLNIVRNQMQSANMSVSITPKSADADDETAEVYQDLYRSIENDPDYPAKHARNWAFDRGLQAGRGWYLVKRVYDDSTPEDLFDQKIVLTRILHQETVVIDPSATADDFSDAGWAFMTYWKPYEDFKREYPKATISNGDSFDVAAVNETVPGWARGGEGEKKAVQVGEYYFKHYTPREVTSADGSQTRTLHDQNVCRYVVAPGGQKGFEVLEKDDLQNPNIPLIPFLASELIPFDDERRIFGMVRPARDPLKIYNYATTTLVERTSLEPKAPYTLDPRQIEGFEGVWRQANTRSFSYLPAKAIIDGQLVGMPQRTPVDTSALMPSVLLLEQADQMIQSASSTPDPVLGKSRKDQSGKAIERLQGQSEASNSGFIYRFAEITLRYEARVIMAWIPKTYDRVGRIAQIQNVRGEVRKVMLNAPFVPDERGRPVQTDTNGRPLPMSPTSQTPPPMGGPMSTTQPQKPKKPKFYDFSRGIYGVAISIGKSYKSQMEEAADQIGMFIEKDPEMAVIMMPMFLRNQSWSGSKEAADLATEYRELKFPTIGKDKDDTESPEMLKSQLQQAQQQIQQMQQAGQAMQQELETKQAEQQAKIQAAQIDAQAKAQLEQSKAQSTIQTEQMKAQAEAAAQAAQAELEVRLQEMKAESDREIAAMKEQAETQRLLLEQRFAEMQARLDREAAEKMAEHQAEQSRMMADREDANEAREEASESEPK